MSRNFSELLAVDFKAMSWGAGQVVSVCGTNGNDAKGKRATPISFKTLTAAKSAALSGDTIVVHPGTYDEFNLAKSGVNWHFVNGAKIVRTNGTLSSVAIFDDNSVGMNFSVTGQGEFTSAGAPVIRIRAATVIDVEGKTCSATASEAIWFDLNNGPCRISFRKISNTGAFSCVKIGTGDTAAVILHADSIIGAGGVGIEIVEGNNTVIRCPTITGSGAGVSLANGPVSIYGAEITGSSIGMTVINGFGENLLVGCKIVTTNVNNPALTVLTANTLSLKGCTLVAGTSASFSVVGTSSPSMRVYGGCEANKAVSGITQLVGTVLVSASVT